MPLAEQIAVFLWTLAIGMMAGLCYVVYRVISDILNLKKIGTYAGDIFFWILLTIISFAVLLRANYGELRLYVFIGLFLGAFLFTKLLGGYFYRIMKWLFWAMGRVLSFLAMLFLYAWRALTFPFRIVFIIIVFPVRLLGRLLGGVGRFTGKIAGNSYARGRAKVAGISSRIFRKLIKRR
ncbi:MAG: spore cortex biosynthesis protein YabQ [Bacillota bacterium]